MTNKKLLALRARIDKVDASLLKTLKQRFELTQKVGELKVLHNLPVLDKKREEEKLSSVSKQWTMKNPDAEFIRKLFSTIMAESRKNHKRLKDARK